MSSRRMVLSAKRICCTSIYFFILSLQLKERQYWCCEACQREAPGGRNQRPPGSAEGGRPQGPPCIQDRDGRGGQARHVPGQLPVSGGSSKVGVDLGHHRGALADGGAHALHGSGTHVADREDARHARLERKPRIAARRDETLVVHRHVAVLRPVCARIGAEEEEHVADGPRFLMPGTASPSDRLGTQLARP